ncbi:CHAP domain-containing protein [Nonomuraea sp. NPDC049758]|uniref:CHAP domain-containing protein n=1 Tax=Nonomuraea sp. NPDC049758 TaxID=3154360 RepID=UPI003418A8C0
MTPEMQKYIDLLESQLGYAEKAGAYTKFGDWYGKTVEFDADYSAAPWCDMYLSWAAHKLGYQEWIGQFAWTVRHAEWFKAQGAWGKTPKPGAIVFYDWSGTGEIDNIDHVGIVTRVEGDTIFTIEGNIDGGVAKRKERDTSKVVGYGYPERIKARLDEEAAQKRADEQAATPARPGDVGTLQLPADSLSSLIPHVEQERAAEAPLAARPKAKSDKPARTTASSPPASPAGPSASASPATGAAPVPTTAAGKSGQKSKHAKATTADTTSATAEPLPTLVDASSTGSMPAIGSPSLVGSALIAALALVALAKTRQSRLRPATASAKAARVRAAATLSAREGVTLSTAALSVTSAESTSTGVTAGVTAGVSAGVTAGIAVPVALPVPVPVAVPLPGTRSRRGTHAAPSRHRRRRRPAETRHEHTRPSSLRATAEPADPFELTTTSSGTGFERAAASPGTGRRHRFELAAGSPETGREGGSETGREGGFEPAAVSPEAGQGGRIERGAGSFEAGRSRTFEFAAPVPEPGPAGGAEVAGGVDAFEPFTARTAPPRRLDSASFRPAPDTAPFEPMFDTGPMVPISLPPATSTFSAFSPSSRPGAEVAARTRTTPRAAQASGIGATYQGRRRRSEPLLDAYASEHPFFMDEFTADSVPRGRRHRRAGTAGAAGTAVSQHPRGPRQESGGTSTIDAFVQDAPLRGRRHRAPTRESTPDWGRQPA